MTATTTVNTGQSRKQILFMKPETAKFLYTVLVILITLAECILPILFYPEYLVLFVITAILVSITILADILYLFQSKSTKQFIISRMILQVITLTVLSTYNILCMGELENMWEFIGAIIMYICYIFALGQEYGVVIEYYRYMNTRSGTSQVSSAATPAVSSTKRNPGSGSVNSVTEPTVDVVSEDETEPTVEITPDIPKPHVIPPKPLNPEIQTTPNLYPTLPKLEESDQTIEEKEDPECERQEYRSSSKYSGSWRSLYFDTNDV